MNKTVFFQSAAALGLSIAAAAQSQLASRGQVVLASGDPVAALPGITIDPAGLIDSGALNLDGYMLFRAPLAGTNVFPSDNKAYFFGRTKDDLRLLVRSGDAEPSGTMPGVFLTTGSGTGLSGTPRLSPEGKIVVYGAALYGDGVVTTGGALAGQNNSCLYWGVPGFSLVLARYGDLAPGGGGSRYQTAFNSLSYQSTALNGRGIAAFPVTLVGGDVVGTTNNAAWIYGTYGNLQILQRKGDLELGGTVGIGALGYNCMLNAAGQALHDETLSQTLGINPATTANDSIVFVFTPGSGNAVLVREGDQAAGCAAGTFYGVPSVGQGFSPSGVASFTAPLIGPAITAGADDQALFVGRAGSLAVAARRGDVAPGTGGEKFATINFVHTSNDQGAVCFYASLSGPGITAANGRGLWTGKPGDLRLVARDGDPAPGIQNGVFSSGGVVAGSCMLNERGQVIFTGASVTVGGTTLVGAVYGWDPVLGLQLLAAQGDVFTTGLGAQTGLSYGGMQFPSGDGCPLSLNNNGDYYLRAGFASGSALLRGHLGSVVGTPSALSVQSGGVQTLELDAGAAHAGRLYVVVGSMTGTRPGFSLNGFHVPLNPDSWTDLTLSIPNSTIFTNTVGMLDAQGKATAQFNLPAGMPALAGLGLHHAFGVFDGNAAVQFVSEPASLLLW